MVTRGAASATAALAALLAGCPSYPDPCAEACVAADRRRACGTAYEGESFGGPPVVEACPRGASCVEGYRSWGEVYAVCGVGPREPRCAADTDATFCDGERLVVCRGEYRTAEVDCAGAGLVCVTIPARSPTSSSPAAATESACVSSRAPSPGAQRHARVVVG